MGKEGQGKDAYGEDGGGYDSAQAHPDPLPSIRFPQNSRLPKAQKSSLPGLSLPGLSLPSPGQLV